MPCRTKAGKTRRRFPDPLMDHMKHLAPLAGAIDSHCHLAFTAARGVPVNDILTRCFGTGMSAVLDIAVTADDIAERLKLTHGFPHVVHSVGVHPAEAARADAAGVSTILRDAAATCPSVVAIGETGLDWYRGRRNAAAQYALFEAQLQLACELDLPLIIHNRDAADDILALLRTSLPPRGGIMHCYSAHPDYVAEFVDLGFALSFAGNLTFPRAEETRQAAVAVPQEWLLVETDSPFLAPVPARGRPNHPGYIGHTYRALAALRRQPLDELTRHVAQNFARLFPSAPLAPARFDAG
ncbi:MAG: TatD family deoxyribonuclease [Spirochaetaceae bacterium]|nr:MAG: TatD family deoxyribonuclease [Spirochaetaceae bacterium]